MHPDYHLWCQKLLDNVVPGEVTIDLEPHSCTTSAWWTRRAEIDSEGLPWEVLHKGASRWETQLAWKTGVIRIVEESGGFFQIPAEPGVDAFEVRAPGYRSLLRVVGDSTPEPVEIRMERCWKLSGRVELGDLNSSKVSCHLVPRFSEYGNLGPPIQEKSTILRLSGDVSRPFELNKDGGFEVQGLQADAYMLLIDAPNRVPYSRLVKRQSPEIGSVELQQGGIVRGIVLAPPEVERTMVYIAAGGRSVQVSSDGSFDLSGVAAGDWPISVSMLGVPIKRYSPQGTLAMSTEAISGSFGGPSPRVHVVPGGIAEVEVDLAELLPEPVRTLRVKVWVGAEPYEGGNVALITSAERHSGKKRGAGVWDFDLLEGCEVKDLVLTEGMSYPVEVPFAAREIEVRLPDGRLRIQLSDSIALPPQALISVKLKCISGPGTITSPSMFIGAFQGEQVLESKRGTLDWSPVQRFLGINDLLPGRYSGSLLLIIGGVEVSDFGTISARERLFSRTDSTSPSKPANEPMSR
ncbi:MAG: hypothetical protein R3E96_11600 [Planctomycetota bacterium]